MEGNNKNSQHISIIYTERRKPASKLEHLNGIEKKNDLIIRHRRNSKVSHITGCQIQTHTHMKEHITHNFHDQLIIYVDLYVQII
jgi:hypothetical protein